jgi:hypothetical protein
MSPDWPKVPVSVILTKVTTNRGEPYVELRVEDKDASVRLLKVRLDAAEFLSLISGSYTNAVGEIPPQHLIQRAGKVCVHATIPHPKDVTDGYNREPSEVMHSFAEHARSDGGWESASWTRHNFGWKLTGYQWVNRDAAPSENADPDVEEP